MQQQESITWPRLLCLIAALGCHFFLPQAARAGATEWVDIQISDGRLLVETEIGGQSGYAMIDTGAGLNAINGDFLRAAGLEFEKGRSIQISGVFATERRPTYKRVPVNIFGNTIDFEKIVELDFGSSDIQMILGASFLRNFIFQFDYPNKRMRLITRDSLDMKQIKNVESKKNGRGGSPLVKVRLTDKVDAWLMMDTGATGGLLIDRDLANQLDWLDTYAVEKVKIGGVNAVGDAETFTIPSIGFGPLEIVDVRVSVPAQGESAVLFEKHAPLGTRIARGSESKGLLGYDILQHFVVTVDYKSGYVHIHAE